MYGKLFYFIATILVLSLVSSVSADLLAHYEFEGNYDNSGTGSAVGTPTGGAKIIEDAVRGQVLSLDGVDDYVYIGNDDAGYVTKAITVAAWIKTTALGKYDSIVTKGYNWRLIGSAGNAAMFQCMNTQPAEGKAVGVTNISDGQWHHVAATYDGKMYKMFVDGVEDANTPSEGFIQNFGSNVVCIGAHYKTSDPDARRFFKGLIDDVRIYDDAQTAEDIKAMAVAPVVEEVKEEPAVDKKDEEPVKKEEEKAKD